MDTADNSMVDKTLRRAAPDAEFDWNYLRTHLDTPGRLRPNRLSNRLLSGLAGWVAAGLGGLSHGAEHPPRLTLLARIPLGQRQAISLVEAEGVHLLVGTSADAPPSFFALHASQQPASVPAVAGQFAQLPAALYSPARRNQSSQPSQSSRQTKRSGLWGRISW